MKEFNDILVEQEEKRELKESIEKVKHIRNKAKRRSRYKKADFWCIWEAIFVALFNLLLILIMLYGLGVLKPANAEEKNVKNVNFGFVEVLPEVSMGNTMEEFLSYQKPNFKSEEKQEVVLEEEVIEEQVEKQATYTKFKATHYCGCSKCCGKWSGGSESEATGALGTKLTPNYSIAVDTSIIPLGTILYDSEGNEYKAEDTGSAIKGYRIDIFTGNHEEALNLGVKEVELFWE